MIRVAVDAMGGDHAPQAEVAGVLAALAEWPGRFRVALVGQPDVIAAELAKHPAAAGAPIDIVPASEVIGMAESPLQAIRSKRDSSIMVGLGLHRKQGADAFVSCGNTGAILAASTVVLGLYEGVERATVAPEFPALGGPVIVLDAGANVDCSARELVGFALLGTVYARDVLGRESPRVGLLNVGEEEGKGTAVAKETYRLLKETAGINFVGNIEGRDIVSGRAGVGRLDVVVCDGFVGNIVLKFYESIGRLILDQLVRLAPDVVKRPELGELFRFFDYATVGGAPLLGVKGVSVICHGSSNAKAIANAIGRAVRAAETDLHAHIGAQMAARPAVAGA
ncbi:MAG: phosphate acyltransferase PlsX [Gemmatimonadales bacterium]|nr:phosphate acyltransferase PlsX [Gemmatimonadales bacterium]